jgi:hypothetical protein
MYFEPPIRFGYVHTIHMVDPLPVDVEIDQEEHEIVDVPSV